MRRPLAGRSSIGLAAPARFPIIGLARGAGLRGSFEAAARRAHVDVRVALEASDPGVVMDLAAHGLGVAILARSMAAARAEVLHAVDIRPTIISTGRRIFLSLGHMADERSRQ